MAEDEQKVVIEGDPVHYGGLEVRRGEEVSWEEVAA
jgi:hypothetical protein